MNEEQQVVDYLKHLPERRQLATRLGADQNRLCCYYICPLSNLESIIRDGIMCHDAAPATVDLSSGEVQYRRHEIWLGRSTAGPRFRRVGAHSCVNFFWNPLNWTFSAFQRNALLLRHASSEPTDEMVCVLEVGADSLLQDSGNYWGASGKNVARGGRPYFELANLNFDWQAIFSPKPPASTDRKAADSQAAELIVFKGTGSTSEPIPWDNVRRVLIPSRRTIGREAERSLAHPEVTVARSDIFEDERILLKDWREFVSSLDEFRHAVDGAVAEKIEIAFRGLLDFGARVGTPHRQPYAFESDSQAYGLHGIGHTSRVMFWTRFLLCYEDTPSSSASDLCLVAALVHDLGRHGNNEDAIHGVTAAARCAHIIRAALDSASDDSVARVLNAVKMHCRDDADCPVEKRDLVWTVLKDADALDRGRFAWPNRKGGCNQTCLRTNLLRHDDHRGSIMWAAFRLALMTKNMTWSKSPCVDLFERFSSGLRAAVHEGAFRSESSKGLALLLLEGLIPLDRELRSL